MIKATEKHFNYLDTLRDTGAINMLAAAPCLAGAFGIPLKESRDILVEWIDSFEESK